MKPETPALIQINGNHVFDADQTLRYVTRVFWRRQLSLIRAVHLPRQMQAYRSRDAGQFASDVPKKTDRLPPSELGDPFKVTRFGISNDSRLVDPLSPKHYPERGAHERKKPNKRNPQ